MANSPLTEDELRDYLDSHDSGIPFVSAWTNEKETYLLWQYKRDDFFIDFDASRVKTSADDCLGKQIVPLYKFKSLESALDFIKRIEAVRQHTSFPLIQLGVIPWGGIT